MKKIALLITLVLVFSLSCVFATDTAAPLTIEQAVTSGETLSGEDITTPVDGSGEVEEPSNIVEVSGEAEDTASGEFEYIEDAENNETEEETVESSNSAMIGAIIAIIIVIAVVAIAAILRKD